MRAVAWATMAILAVLIALYALATLVLPGFGPPFISDRRAVVPWAVSAHLIGSLWALAVGPWQFAERLRKTALTRHRWLGRSYVVGVLVGGIGGLALAPLAETGAVARTGFAVLGVIWLAFTGLAFVRIRQGDQGAHRRWMIRSFALTLAAVTLRIYLPVSFAAGITFEQAYPAIAWLCWVPNLVVAEALFVRRGRIVPGAIPSPQPASVVTQSEIRKTRG